MDDITRIRYLRVALLLIGLLFVFGLEAMMVLSPEGWVWEPRHYAAEQRIMGIYFVLGIFLLIASRDPKAHRSLVQFTFWSSLAHGGIMLAQAASDPVYTGHFFGDVPAMLLVAAVLGGLMPKRWEDQLGD